MTTTPLLEELLSVLEHYKPHYQADLKHLGGDVTKWLSMLKISKEDVAKAVKDIKNAAAFKQLLSDYGLEYNQTARGEANGTLKFHSKIEDANYLIHANGQIRREQAARSGGRHIITKLVSPKPHVVPGDPVKSLIKMYTMSLAELHKKLKSKKELAK